MRRTPLALLALAALWLALATPATADVDANVAVSFDFFYDSLGAHGHWISSPRYGYVFRPVGVYADWRPYYDGSWVYTDYGWTFVSAEPWAWATYHYGRWYVDPYWGWVWVPGYEWAPAWVVFHQGGGFVGWAPLPPGVLLGAVIGGGYRIHPQHYCFVEERHFADRHVRRHALAVERNTSMLRYAPNVTRMSRHGERYAQLGLDNLRIERAAERRIEKRRIVDLPRGGPQTRVERDRVGIFRPAVRAEASHPPRRVLERREVRPAPRLGSRAPAGRELRSSAVSGRQPQREVSPPVERHDSARRSPPARYVPERSSHREINPRIDRRETSRREVSPQAERNERSRREVAPQAERNERSRREAPAQVEPQRGRPQERAERNDDRKRRDSRQARDRKPSRPNR